MSGGSPARLIGATRRFTAGGDGSFALAPTDLALEPGSWTVVTGPSGAGKTTLLTLLAGLDRPDSGQVLLFGVDVAGASESALARVRRDRVGVVPQKIAFLDHLPLWQNVASRLVPLGVSSAERRRRAQRALARVDLDGRLDRLPRELSGGEQQRAALARALVAEPSLLIADEPTSNVDAATAERIAGLFTELRAAGATLVMSSHDRAQEARADRRLALAAGVLSEVAP